jgi:RNA polymerase primary sigma factor
MAKQAARKIETVTETPDAEEAQEVAEESAEREEPSAHDLLRAQNDAEKALKALQRDSGGDSTLSKYFREMAGHRVLTPAEEVSAAVEVERLEIGYWEALLAYAPVFETVAAVLERLEER